MKVRSCCTLTVSGSSRRQTIGNSGGDSLARQIAGRFLDIAGWIIPGAILALLPKCPACLAAYIAVVTGVGLSISSAMYVRTALLILCATLLSYLTANGLLRFVFRKWASRRYRVNN
jgi:hypothetical protein